MLQMAHGLMDVDGNGDMTAVVETMWQRRHDEEDDVSTGGA